VTNCLQNLYRNRELPIEGITSKLIYDNLRPDIEKSMCSKENLLEVIKHKKTDVLITLGAGDIENYVPQIYELLKDK
jgi:UDP-N-acetylmuramate--alanine ligase